MTEQAREQVKKQARKWASKQMLWCTIDVAYVDYDAKSIVEIHQTTHNQVDEKLSYQDNKQSN